MSVTARAFGLGALAALALVAPHGVARAEGVRVSELMRVVAGRSGQRVLAIRQLPECPAEDLRTEQVVYILVKEIATNRGEGTSLRSAAIDTIGEVVADKLPDQSRLVIGRLLKILASSSQRGPVRAASARALARICSSGAAGEMSSDVVRALVSALEASDDEVAAAAAEGLGGLSDRVDRAGAVAVLIESLGHPSAKVAGAASAALKRLTGQDLGSDGEAWRRWLAANARSLAARDGSESGRPPAVEAAEQDGGTEALRAAP